ncbi:MAG: sugar O-acetyltransferase [Bacilli bacterium]|nr:sugar O-acetyltransferase [Bacilli bacterium]
MSEKEKMLQGKIYESLEEQLLSRRRAVNEFCIKYNNLPEAHPDRAGLLKAIFPHSDESFFVRGPVFVDYGENVYLGKDVYFNFNLVILDVCPVHIGNNCFFGPNISILTALHPLIASERELYFDEEKGYVTNREYGKPITIGNDCWFGGNVTVLPGVTIHDNVVVGAGSVVTHDLESGYVYAGNPAKKIKEIRKEDSIFLKKELW